MQLMGDFVTAIAYAYQISRHFRLWGGFIIHFNSFADGRSCSLLRRSPPRRRRSIYEMPLSEPYGRHYYYESDAARFDMNYYFV